MHVYIEDSKEEMLALLCESVNADLAENIVAPIYDAERKVYFVAVERRSDALAAALLFIEGNQSHWHGFQVIKQEDRPPPKGPSLAAPR